MTLLAYYSRHAARWATICRHYARGRRDYWAIVDGHVRPVVVTAIDPRGYAKISGRRTRVAACHLFLSQDRATQANSSPQEPTVNKRGRPPATNPRRNRSLGKMNDMEWEELQIAAERDGLPFSTWARDWLLFGARSAMRLDAHVDTRGTEAAREPGGP